MPVQLTAERLTNLRISKLASEILRPLIQKNGFYPELVTAETPNILCLRAMQRTPKVVLLNIWRSSNNIAIVGRSLIRKTSSRRKCLLYSVVLAAVPAISSILWLPNPLAAASQTNERQLKIAVLSFGDSAISKSVSDQLALNAKLGSNIVLDRDQTQAATRGIGYTGSLNLSLQEARDLGAAIGCDFYFLGQVQTLRRSPSTGAPYFESYASIFLVSARTGKLVFWERQEFRRPTAIQAEQALLTSLAAASTRNRYYSTIRRVAEEERAARARAIDAATPVIEVMSDDEPNGGVRAPRPFRRVKPPYPDAAAHDQVEATIDALVDIDEKGKVRHVEIARWAGYGLDESVVNTVKQMDFFPAMRDGRAVPTRVLLRYNFRKPPPQ